MGLFGKDDKEGGKPDPSEKYKQKDDFDDISKDKTNDKLVHETVQGEKADVPPEIKKDEEPKVSPAVK